MINKLNINIITPFPKMFDVILNESILLKAQQKSMVKFYIYNLFDFLISSFFIFRLSIIEIFTLNS